MENTFFNATSLVIAVISLAALILSFISFRKNTESSKKINSKEHDLAENLKSIVLEIISNLRAIQAKAMCEPHMSKEVDYANEILALEKIQSSPEYFFS